MNMKNNIYGYMYNNHFAIQQNQHSIVNQLYFNFLKVVIQMKN